MKSLYTFNPSLLSVAQQESFLMTHRQFANMSQYRLALNDLRIKRIEGEISLPGVDMDCRLLKHHAVFSLFAGDHACTGEDLPAFQSHLIGSNLVGFIYNNPKYPVLWVDPNWAENLLDCPAAKFIADKLAILPINGELMLQSIMHVMRA